MRALQALTLTVCVSLTQICVLHAQPAADPVPAFEAFIAKANAATNKNSYVYKAIGAQKWLRAYASTSELRYDVKKTDSLVTPVAGEVKFQVRTLRSGSFDTQAEAEATSDIDRSAPASMMEISLRYGWRDGSWHFQGGERINWFDDPRFSKDRHRVPINQDAASTAPVVLRPWFR